MADRGGFLDSHLGSIQPSCWMGQLLASFPGAADLPLQSMFMPGTHDTGTWELSTSSTMFLENATRGLSKTLAHIIKLPGIGKGIKGLAAKWSRTQSLDAYCQLRSGIRCVL